MHFRGKRLIDDYSSYKYPDDHVYDYGESVGIQQESKTRRLWDTVCLFPSIRRIFMAQASCVCLLAGVAGTVAVFGLVVLITVGLLRAYAPVTISHVKPLHFDYTKSQAVAVASLTNTHTEQQSRTAGMQTSGGLPTAHQLQVSVKLRLPETPRNKEIFQLTGELVTGDGKVAARSTRPVKLSYRSTLVHHVRQLTLLPLVLSGLLDESAIVRVKLFELYEEKEAHPVAYFRAYLSPSYNGKELPEVYDAFVTIRLRLGIMSTIMYWLRPGLVASSVLGLLGAALLAGGSTALLMLLLCASFLYMAGRGPQPRKRLPVTGTMTPDMLDAASDTSLAACPKGAPLFDEDAYSNNLDSPESLPDVFFRSESKNSSD